MAAEAAHQSAKHHVDLADGHDGVTAPRARLLRTDLFHLDPIGGLRLRYKSINIVLPF